MIQPIQQLRVNKHQAAMMMGFKDTRTLDKHFKGLLNPVKQGKQWMYLVAELNAVSGQSEFKEITEWTDSTRKAETGNSINILKVCGFAEALARRTKKKPSVERGSGLRKPKLKSTTASVPY